MILVLTVAQLENERTRYDGAAERHDMVVIQMTRQMDGQQQLLLEYKHEDKQPFWKRWFGKSKALPPPGDVMDMDAETGGQEEMNGK